MERAPAPLLTGMSVESLRRALAIVAPRLSEARAQGIAHQAMAAATDAAMEVLTAGVRAALP